jgi:Putative peptidoglycan binding domain
MPQWWENNRLLALGSRGEDVKRLQQGTNNWLATPMKATGVFDAATQARIEEIQRLNGLVADGKAGPITQSLILEGSYTFSITTPPVIRQPLNLCWGAALESVLKSTWHGWPKLTAEQLKEKYKGFLLQHSGFMSEAGIEKAMVDHRASIKLMKGSDVRIEKISAFLFRHKKQIVLGDFLLGAGHVRVLYGVTVRKGQPGLMVMDPLKGLITLDLSELQSAKASIFLAAPFTRDVVDKGL